MLSTVSLFGSRLRLQKRRSWVRIPIKMFDLQRGLLDFFTIVKNLCDLSPGVDYV
jgi:hypothetical protein